jgi:uncharacterized protein (DUF2235 family)
MNSQENHAAGVVRNPRQLVLACDGTNNTLTGGVHDTNVLKLIARLAPADNNQLVYYDPGVGSPDQLPPLSLWNEFTRRRERIEGMAKGKGIYENIEEAYLFLVENFQPGDQIYIFGFSRGAFTARCVAGMVNLFGILRPECKPLLLTLIRVYFSTPNDKAIDTANPWARFTARQAEHRKKLNEDVARKTGIADEPAPQDVLDYLTGKKARKSTRAEVARQVRDNFTSPHGKNAAIHFTGVWDTVESVGIPILSKRSITSDGTTSGKDGLRHIRHALSMDEHRWSFAPRLYWEEDYLIVDPNEPSNTRSLRQRWFRGAHSDVGGGYDVNESGLSDQAYSWMLKEATACGLRMASDRSPSEPEQKPYIAHDACFDTPWWGVAGLVVRTNITHSTATGKESINVILEGAATNTNQELYSVWSAAAKRIDLRFWLALACTIAFWMLCGGLGHAAFHDNAAPETFTQISQGAAKLDVWQRTFAWDAWQATPELPGSAYPAVAAYWAMLADCAFIAAYSWLLGLGAAWSFKEMACGRNPREKVAIVFRLGLAPMIAVLADVAEDALTILTLWSIPHGTWLPIVLGALMMLANVVKWMGLVGSLALVACGFLARTSRHQPLFGTRVGGGPKANGARRRPVP